VSPVRKRGAPQEPRTVHRRPSRDRSQRVFYVVVEGEVTERDYLAFLNAEFGDRGRFFVHPITRRRGMKPLGVVERALDLLAELGQVAGAGQDLAEGRVQVWALFDRDRHRCVAQAFAAAAQSPIRVAFSHPSFDLWLLLHFQNLTSAEDGGSDAVHAKLRSGHAAYAAFARNGEKRVTGARAQALLGREDAAVRRARALIDACPTGTCSAARGHDAACPPLDRDPSTDVWRLVETFLTVQPD
jgi:hypothetical protein